MKREFTKLMAALVLLLFIAPLGMWGQTTVTWPGTSALPGTATAVANDQNVTIKTSSTNSYTNPIRIYANTTVTINALNGAKILSVAYEASSTGNYVEYAQNAPVAPAVTPTVSGKIVTWTYAESSEVTQFTFKPSSQTRTNGISITYKTSTYTITPQSNNASYGTVTLSGSTITASPAEGYRVSITTPYTITPVGSATVVQNGNAFTVTPSANTTVTINFEAIPTHAATFSVNGVTTSSQVAEGAAITFPADPADIGGKTFVGWTNAAIDGTTDTPPTYVSSATMGNSNVTFYAVFANNSGSQEGTLTISNSDFTSVLGGSYASASITKTINGTSYTVNLYACKQASMCQLRSSDSYIQIPTLPGRITNISTTVCNNAGTDPYTGTIRLKSAFAAGNTTNNDIFTKELSSVNSFSIDVTGNITSFYFVTSAGLRLNDLSVAYVVTNYSDYCTTVGAIITVDPDAIELAADELDGTTDITFANLEITEPWDDCHVTFYDATGTNEVAQPDWVIDALVAEDNNAYLVSCSVYANEGPARTAYFKVYAYDENDNAVYSNLVTLSQAGYVMPSSADTWELTTLSALTADDVFVIVGTIPSGETYALPYSNGSSSAPAVVAVTIDNDKITSTVDPSIQWNISGDATNGYVFYPNGDNENWLYCTNNNDGVRVGIDTENTFTFVSGGSINGVAQADYLFHTFTNRYVGIYITSNGSGHAQDWRCYTSATNNIKNQSFAFYKKVVTPTDTNTKSILPYSSDRDHYYLIASPVMAVVPSTENGFLTNNYDLYRFDQSREDEEWQNYEVTPFYLLSGKGYLYANSGNNGNATTITFTGMPYNGNGEVTLSKVQGVKFSGWNLIGNPWNNEAILKDANDQSQAYYTINQINNEVAAGTLGASISAMEGVFVVADNDGDVVTFVEQQLSPEPNNNIVVSQLSINVNKSRGESIDRAIVRFDNGNQLPKIQLNPNHTKVYFTKDNKDYAVVRSANEGEMPVSFKAETRGTYTLSFETEGVEMNYLHLIDNKTGNDVDLLATPSYTFEANSSDYESRFRLVFNANAIEENASTDSETFAYFNGSEWVINNNGNATLQVIDMMGRVLSSETLNGNANVNINQPAGIYMLRLVNGENVKVQKVVVR